MNTDIVNNPAKLYTTLISLMKKGATPPLILLDLFYKRLVPNSDSIESDFISKITAFKDDFRRLKALTLSYLAPEGIDFIRKIRKINNILKKTAAYLCIY